MEPRFSFTRQWYPLSPLEDLDPNQPTAVTLLGLRLVIWKPKSSKTFQVFLDRCPHRLAPLSEGRIDNETGNLMCSYHGWQFNDRGICTHIPQAEHPDPISQEREHLCAVVFPVRQQQDLLWVWPDPASYEAASNSPLPLSPQVDASKGFVWSSYVRDLEYDWQTLVENVADPSHVPFAHHGVQGDRNKAAPVPISIIRSTPESIEAQTSGRLSSTITFKPPCHLEYALSFGDGGNRVGLVTYCIPVAPGKSRIVAQFPRNFAKPLFHLTPRWWEHIHIRNQVLDGDMMLLHQQEHFLHQKQIAESWKTAYKLPTSADRLVIEFRKWFDQYCHGQLPWEEMGISGGNFGNINDNRSQILDRYNQHTRHCRSCRGALSTIQRLQIALLAGFAIAISGVALLPDSLRLGVGLPLIILALLGLGVCTWLRFWLMPKFYFVDYVHAQR